MTAIVVLAILLKSEWTFFQLAAYIWAPIAGYVFYWTLLSMAQKNVKRRCSCCEGSKKPIRRRPANTADIDVRAVAKFFVALKKFAHTAETLAVSIGLGRMYYGTVFAAFMASLLEIIFTLSTNLLRSSDMAMDCVLGSHAFNLLILVLADSGGSSRFGRLFCSYTPSQVSMLR